MSQNKINIIGAGMAGLLAANMLRRHEVTVFEKGSCLPDSHKAVLRFRTTEVSDATGIPFSKHRVEKGFWDGEKVVTNPTLAQINRYSILVTNGTVDSRSAGNLGESIRFFAPQDFIQQMAKNVNIRFGQDFLPGGEVYSAPIISTIPMPVMMDMVAWEPKPDFQWLPIWTVRAKIVAPVFRIHQSIYNSNPEEWYRATIHGDQLILEFMQDPMGLCVHPEEIELMADEAVQRFYCADGQSCPAHWQPVLMSFEFGRQTFGKIRAIEDSERQRFILHLTEQWGIYSLGRFATWRPLLLDDLVKDIKRIETIIQNGNNTYAHRLAKS